MSIYSPEISIDASTETKRGEGRRQDAAYDPVRHHRRTGRVYRAVKAKKLDMERGKALAWILGQLRSALEMQTLENMEKRLEEMAPMIEGNVSRGYTPTARATQLTH